MEFFTAKILILGVNPYVSVPEDILAKLFSSAGKNKGPIPIMGTLDGKMFRQTLIRYQGAWRLYLNTPMRKAAGLSVGDEVEVGLSFDPLPRLVEDNHKFTLALNENKLAKEVFEKLPPSHKKEINKYLNSMKTEESLDRNIEKTILHLLGKKTDKLYALMRRKKDQ